MHAHQIEDRVHETLPPDITDRLLDFLSTSDESGKLDATLRQTAHD